MAIVGMFDMPYIPEASKNHREGKGKNGKSFVKPAAKSWERSLSIKVSEWAKTNQVTIPQDYKWAIALFATFADTGGRTPDAHNFLESAIDAIAKGLKIDDNSKRLPEGYWKVLSTNAPESKLTYWVTIYDSTEEIVSAGV